MDFNSGLTVMVQLTTRNMKCKVPCYANVSVLRSSWLHSGIFQGIQLHRSNISDAASCTGNQE